MADKTKKRFVKIECIADDHSRPYYALIRIKKVMWAIENKHGEVLFNDGTGTARFNGTLDELHKILNGI